MDYLEYEQAVEKIREQNEQYLQLFYNDLVSRGLTDKTIRKHLDNVNFYINEFLCYYQPQTMEVGCYEIGSFLGDWFIRKAMWSNPTSIKSNCSSIKKFYQCMLLHGLITFKDLRELEDTIKEEKDEWIARVEEYNNINIDW